ncbi:MAG TPA: serine protease [Polyangia bacterium]|nr:serine protease [Polyangia bacterium]
MKSFPPTARLVILAGAQLLAAAPLFAQPRSPAARPEPAARERSAAADRARANASPYCAGAYADDLTKLAPRVREYERQTYSYCVRNTATYECLSYGADGTLRRARRRAVAHGTAFAYKQTAGETLLLTNQHVAEWPSVTDEEHPVDGVPAGCKKISDALRIVDGEEDAYERDDTALTRIVADAQLDVAVLKAHSLLPVMPWKLGRSSALRERNVVEVRGFPLAASFHATNVGKVVSAYDHDSYRDWEHDDFVIDALLSQGNSGSPVLAVSCKTGEFELVGIYHAGYSEGSALNVVVGIDQVRDLMTTLKRTKRGGEAQSLDARERRKLEAALSEPGAQFFPFGGATASVRQRSDGALIFELMSRDFPLKTHPMVALEDLPAGDAPADPFGELGRIWFGGTVGLKSYARSELDGDAQAAVTHLLDGLRRDALLAFEYRAAAREGQRSRERYEHMSRLERALKRAAAAQRDQTQALTDLAERLQPHGAETAAPMAEVLTAPAPARLPPAKRGIRPIADGKTETR